MRRFSIGTSVGDAFGLVRRRPLAVFAWGLLMVVPIVLMFAIALPAMSAIVGHPAFGDPAASDTLPPGMFAHMIQFQLGAMLANVGQLLAAVLVYTAVMRAVLRPAETSWLSLRLGMDELRIAVVGLAIGAAFYAVVMVVVLVGMAVAFAVWSGQGEAAGGIAMVIAVFLGIAALTAMFWGLARVSLIAPATVLRKEFAFAEGWRIAAGKGWALLGLLVVAMLVVMVVELLILLVAMVAVIVVSNAGVDWSVPVGSNPGTIIQDWLSVHWYVAVLGVAVFSLFYGLVSVLTVAPFASACRQLIESRPREDASTAPVA